MSEAVKHNPKKRKWEAFPDYVVTDDIVDDAYGQWAVASGTGEIANKRAHARRAILMQQKGGRCAIRGCKFVIKDYRFISYYQFDHVYDRATHPYHPTKGFLQFKISGNDCSNRKIELVVSHALEDTILVCRRHHQIRTTRLEERRRQNNAATETLDDYMQDYL